MASARGYSIVLGDCAGEFDSRRDLTFVEAWAFAYAWARKYGPKKLVVVFGPEYCGCGECGDGLDDDEKEAIDDAVSAGHAMYRDAQRAVTAIPAWRAA